MSDKLLDPFVYLTRSHLLRYKKCAAYAFASLSLENENRKNLLQNEIVLENILNLAVYQSDLQIQRDSVFCVANLSETSELQLNIIKNKGIDALSAVGKYSNDELSLRHVARALSSLTGIDEGKREVLNNKANNVLSILCRLARCKDKLTQRYAALALCNVSNNVNTDEKGRLVQDRDILKTMLFLLRYPDVDVKRFASLSIAALSLGNHSDSKLRILEEGLLAPIIDLLKYPDTEIKRCALLVVNGITLGKHNTSKEAVPEHDGLKPILSGLDQEEKDNDEESTHTSLFLLGTLVENETVRSHLLEMGSIGIAVKLSYSGSIESKRAVGYYFAVLASNIECHEELALHGGMEAIINLASSADIECQEHTAFSLAYIASNRDYQVKLVNMGAVRPLVSMMNSEAESKHYAGLALLKLADNFENHLTIAEEGGIQALLHLGRNRVADEELQYKAALTVGHLASNTIEVLPTKKEKETQ